MEILLCSRHCFKQFTEIISFSPLPYEMPSVIICILLTRHMEKGEIINFFLYFGLSIMCYLSFPNYLTCYLIFTSYTVLWEETFNIFSMKIKVEIQNCCLKTPVFPKLCEKILHNCSLEQ